MNLLLVDDEKRFLTTTSKTLSQKGIKVLTATTGEDALAILKREDVDVVIMDVKMPGMDGITTLREIKHLFPLVEVIMLTGHGTIESAVEGLKSGASDFLTKPISIDLLIAKIKEAFAKKRHLEEKIHMAQSIYERRKAIYMRSPKDGPKAL